MKDFKDMSTLERQIEVIKFCHKPRNKIQIADKFFADERTIRRLTNDYIPSLDFPFMDVDIISVPSDERYKFTLEAGSTELYKNSVHPVCLALNLTEVYLLTVGLLERITNDDVMYDVYVNLLNKIYTQLSEYGQEILNKAAPGHPLAEIDDLKYESESEMFKALPNSRIAYAAKTRCPLIIRWRYPKADEVFTIEAKIDQGNNSFYFLHKGEKISINSTSIEILEIKLGK
jgi:hypothetical protein